MDNRSPVGVCEKHTEGAFGNQYTSWLSLPVFFPAVTLSNHLQRRKDVRLASGKKQIWNNLCGKKPMKKVSEAHFQKVLKRQKSANSTKKSAQTTI
jgi:hypothetical protein